MAARLARRGLVALERATFRTADHVVSTNGSYAEVAIRRGGKDQTDVTVVRTGPDPERLRRGTPVPALRRGVRHLVAYIGVMGPQDGVDLAVRAAAHVVHELGRDGRRLHLHGWRRQLRRTSSLLRDRAGPRGLRGVHRPGAGRGGLDVLSTADVGLSPDPKNPLNDVSTMNKTMEYMAFELPVVAFDLMETRVSAGDAAVYIDSGDVAAYARAIVDLLDDGERPGGDGPDRTATGRERARLALPARGVRRASTTRLTAPRPGRRLMCAASPAPSVSRTAGLVQTMVERIGHRGPDASGVTDLLPTAPVQLGHRRLSIIDLSAAADQPFV